MPRFLSAEQVEFFRAEGYLFPLDALSPAQVADCRQSLAAYEADAGEGERGRRVRVKAHLAFPWIMDVARNPAILDALEDLIGPDILIYLSTIWSKPPRHAGFVSWHQDSAYYGIDPHDEVTVWVALSDSTAESGCVRVLPGTHLGRDYDHVETYDPDNLLSRGQTIEGLDDGGAVNMELRAGQFSLHHEKLLHGSAPNRSDHRRLGISLVCIPARCRSVIGRRGAVLLRRRGLGGGAGGPEFGHHLGGEHAGILFGEFGWQGGELQHGCQVSEAGPILVIEQLFGHRRRAAAGEHADLHQLSMLRYCSRILNLVSITVR